MKFIKAILLMALFISSTNMQASTVAKAMADRGQSNSDKSPIVPVLAVAFAVAGIYAFSRAQTLNIRQERIKSDIPRYEDIANLTNLLNGNMATYECLEICRKHKIPQNASVKDVNAAILRSLKSEVQLLRSEPKYSWRSTRKHLRWDLLKYIEAVQDPAFWRSGTEVNVSNTAELMAKDFHQNRKPVVHTLEKRSNRLNILGWTCAGAAVSLCCWGLASKKK